ncbi:MAG TPA: AsmA-like C-terminal domain-containing protein [Patescibacteria group bacterium]|nr:AsmA-like C-terminal domain-containing protein [Patescibacteria group bacterium]
MKKIVHRVNRTVVLCLEIAGVLALVAILAWLGMLWRLSQGPMNVSPYFTTKLEQAFDRDIEGFDFKLGAAQLTWGGRFQPFEIEMTDVAIRRDDNTPVLAVRKLRVQLSKRNLVFGRVVPRVIRVNGPALRVIRQEDGKLSLNVSDREEEALQPVYGPQLPAAGNASVQPVEQDRGQLVQRVLSLLQKRSGLGILDGLQEVVVSDAILYYDDRVLDVRWRSRDADVAVRRGGEGISARLLASLDLDAARKTALRADIRYKWETRRTETMVSFTGFNPATAAQHSPSLKALSGVDISLAGSFAFGLGEDFRPVNARFALMGNKGLFSLGGLYATPLPVEGFFLQGRIDAALGTADINQVKLDLGGPLATASAKIATEGSARVATVTGELLNTPMDNLGSYWPATLAPDVRGWVTSRLTKGTADKATFALVAAYDPAAEKKVAVRELGGTINFTGIDVNYLSTMPPVLGVSGVADYDRTSFRMKLDGGRLLDMKVGKSTVNINGLDRVGNGGHCEIEVKANAQGSLKSALKVIDSKPLEFPAKLGLNSSEVAGDTKLDLTLKFPIKKALTLKEIQVAAKATLEDVRLKNVVAGLDLTGGPLKLDVDNEALKISGKGKLADMPVEFDWRKNFLLSGSVSSHLVAQLPLNAPALAAFGVPSSLGISGSIPASVEYTLRYDKSATLAMKGDAKPAGFNFDMIDFAKLPGSEGRLGLTILLQDNKVQRITGLTLQGGGLALNGDIDFGRDGMGNTEVRKATFREFSYGDTHVALSIANKGREGYAITATGRQVDASSLFKQNSAAGNDAEAAKQTAPIRLNLSASRMLTGKDRWLDNVKIVMVKNAWKRLDQLEIDARSGKGKIFLRYLPVSKGHTLKVEAEDAGAALRALGLSKSIGGGILRIEGHPRANGGSRDLVGVASLNNFKINDAPVIAKLLNAMSLVGMLQMMSNNGIAFKKARVNFAWIDKGPPQQPQNVRLLKLSDGKTFGSSLGLTFEGLIDNWKNVYDLEGTIVPASGVSKFLNIIPIVGTILTAGGEGIFAATYKIKGTKDDPQVSVNPLSALAPGILRKIFFE